MELMLAVSIFAVIALCLYSVFSGGIRVWRRQEEGFKYYHAVRLALDRMATDLRNSIEYSLPEKVGLTSDTNLSSVFTGEKKQLSFVTLIGMDLAKVTYYLDNSSSGGHALKRKIVLQKEGFRDENSRDEVLARGLDDLSFEYAYEADTDAPDWRDAWAQADSNKGLKQKIPAGVRITLVLKNETFIKTVFVPHGSLGKQENT